MSLNNVKFIISATLLAIIVDTTALKCVEETACSCHLADGDFYDLNKLSAQGPLNTGANPFNYTFSFQPCKNVKMNMVSISPFSDTGGRVALTDECNNGAGVSLCSRYVNATPISLGNTTETRWNLLESGGAELELSHANYTTRITLVCCKECNSTILNLDEKPEPHKFHLTLTTRDACKIHGPRRGISTGSLLVILLFVFSGVYLLVGALALKFFRGAMGWEMIPNYDFWSDVPGLFRDGVTYTFSGCSADTYDRI